MALSRSALVRWVAKVGPAPLYVVGFWSSCFSRSAYLGSLNTSNASFSILSHVPNCREVHHGPHHPAPQLACLLAPLLTFDSATLTTFIKGQISLAISTAMGIISRLPSSPRRRYTFPYNKLLWSSKAPKLRTKLATLLGCYGLTRSLARLFPTPHTVLRLT